MSATEGYDVDVHLTTSSTPVRLEGVRGTEVEGGALRVYRGDTGATAIFAPGQWAYMVGVS